MRLVALVLTGIYMRATFRLDIQISMDPIKSVRSEASFLVLWCNYYMYILRIWF
jgi:hypothetical protein